MANNRLYLVDQKTGKQLLLAKSFGRGWNVASGLEEKLHEFLAQRDEDSDYATIGESDVGGRTTLIVATEYGPSKDS